MLAYQIILVSPANIHVLHVLPKHNALHASVVQPGFTTLLRNHARCANKLLVLAIPVKSIIQHL